MTASLHKLTAGSGYDYLTRQVAAQDSTEKGHASLASYYSEKGEVPGSWWGSGLVGLGDLAVGDQVSAEQMKALFGGGLHPNMANRMAALPMDASPGEIREASRLGAPFKVFSGATSFQKEVAIRCSDWELAHAGVEVPTGVRAEIRNDIATEHFVERFGRAPSGLELSSEVARLSRDPSTACAGYDVTFTPVKSVSALWAVAPVGLAARIEEAHNAAVADALRFLEQRALFTRCGADGVRQVDVTGLVAAMFVHRDSRAGDPNLHTHVAVANKVQTLDGKWLAIDGRLIFKAKVAVSETYNTQLEAHLNKLGIRFHERPDTEPGKRPVREVVGVPAALLERWSSRRVAIVARQGELAARFQHDHGRPPTPVEAIKLAQQATLETRDAKHEPRSVAQQRTTWRAEAQQVVGEVGITSLVVAATAGVASVLPVPAGWATATAGEVVAAVEGGRATWQVWHLRAEASRRARERATDPAMAEVLTGNLLREAVRLSELVGDAGGDGLSEPTVLRRRDGASVYTVAGAQLYTSGKVLAAESLMVELSGRTGGRRVGEMEVSLALLASTANGVVLNAGQTNLVREMATSGARVQLALAAAGSGKTTAIKVLTQAWREGGGTVLGLAPSAVAASVLRDQTGDATTVAKYVWDLEHGRRNGMSGEVGPGALVIVDEAGMADTISLAAVIEHVVGCGGSVRLVGDDQQLAAISAGGVLRDIAEIHGAVELTELMRFQDMAEASASLALREGRPEALGFYLDAERIHPGTQESSLETAFAHWTADRAEGWDSLMLASTRDTVTDLNRRARAHRLTTNDDPARHEVEVGLVDGNRASVGDVIITRMNDRRLPMSATDWVKNGDRWIVLRVTDRGVVQARHCDSGLRVTLPQDYVSRYVQLGYAVTVHAAQGLTVDVTRGVLTGVETRQQLYVMATRGRLANHLYVPVVGDGDEHSLVHPTTLRPETAVDILQTILARDGAARSATTETREQTAPAIRLTHAAGRYVDALHVAAETLIEPSTITALDRGADAVVDGLTSCAAWPALRAALLLNTLDGRDPLVELRGAVAARELGSAQDPAAVLTWRIHPPEGAGTLPWLPPIPTALTKHPDWGPYLTARTQLVTSAAAGVREVASHLVSPGWALPGQTLTPALIEDVEVFRAATGVEADDRRVLGPLQLGATARTWQRQLEQRLRPNIASVWADMLSDLHPEVHADPFAISLTHKIAALHASGVPVTEMLAEAAADGPLPAEQPAAALWWRLSRHLTHTHNNTITTQPAPISWGTELRALVGDAKAIELERSPWWPTLVNSVTQGLEQGIPLRELLTTDHEMNISAFDDHCQALMWRAQQLTTTPPNNPEDEPPHPDDLPPEDQYHSDTESSLGEALRSAARLREATELDFTAIELRRDFAAADRWTDTHHTPERLALVNDEAATFYTNHLPGSWAHPHLIERLGTDIAGDERFRAGYAPHGWTNLVNHLRRYGISDDEMLTAGVATLTRDGRLIDKFRDRLIFPITADSRVLGFVGRRNPNSADDTAAPKYLNTATTPLFSKRDVLFVHDHLTPNTIPVIVEGPIDAIAITLAGQGHYIGVGPLGTAFTHEQCLTLSGGRTPIIATDADTAGIVAAENIFWLLAAHRLDPTRAALPAGSDPAAILQALGPARLVQLLDQARPQADHMTQERLAHLPRLDAIAQVAKIFAARPSGTWPELASLAIEDRGTAQRALLTAATTWTTTPIEAADTAGEQTRQLRHRLQQPPEIRWKDWAVHTNQALLQSEHWPAIAAHLDKLDLTGVNINFLAQRFRQSPSNLVLAILSDFNDPDQSVLRDLGGFLQPVAPTQTRTDGRHRHHRIGPSPTTAPRR
ncbi:MobF family relaxase [Tessaracoccus antarcticus]|uniref:Toprim domain-containing protein n=1 Tax=Tessaracoccus antarcticus TaxID=2479848 RepID=A0A3M0GKM7_9ACTN|nr:MobF family relaxase [Tessaracoccus antarcticus]RMB57856.1 toprim domain-containing protein [Tessaracoccus antarcticus]